ncbi:unnamed protein product, partial [Effrenium voratum]
FKDWALLSMCLGAVFVISQPKAGPFGSGFPTESLFLPGMQRFCAQVPPTDRPIASLHHGSLLWTYPAGRGCGLCSPSLSGTSHLSQRGGRPGGGHRGGAGALGGAAAGPRLRQRGGHAAELVGGRHLPRADLRRCICGGFGQPPHQAPYGGEGRGGFHEVRDPKHCGCLASECFALKTLQTVSRLLCSFQRCNVLPGSSLS